MKAICIGGPRAGHYQEHNGKWFRCVTFDPLGSTGIVGTEHMYYLERFCCEAEDVWYWRHHSIGGCLEIMATLFETYVKSHNPQGR